MLRQQLELTKLELADTKERETNSRNAYSLLLRTMNEMSFAGNESLLVYSSTLYLEKSPEGSDDSEAGKKRRYRDSEA